MLLINRKTGAIPELFLFISIIGFIMYAVLAFYLLHFAHKTLLDEESFLESVADIKYRYGPEFKYVLVWTTLDFSVNKIGEGDIPFIKNGCPYHNCLITTEKNLLNDDYTNFDAIIFDINVVRPWMNMPEKRQKRQKYIFYSMEAPDRYPICNILADNYFNWTWSYKLHADIVSPYIVVKDLKGQVVAPSTEVKWITNMTQLSENHIRNVKSKSKAVAWVISKCHTQVNRMEYAKELQLALKEHSLELDMYGCKTSVCPNEGCSNMIKRDYFFYLAYEDSIGEDYVTEEVLMAYDNNAVPIVLGGADYHMFLPYKSYIDARLMSADKLAAFIHYSIRVRSTYHNFYRWKNHYTISKTDNSRGPCSLCALLSDSVRFDTFSKYEHLRKWWYSGALKDRCYPRGAIRENVLLSYLNKTRKRNNPL